MNTSTSGRRIFTLPLCFVLILCLLFSSFTFVSADTVSIPEAPESVYVLDEAEVISDSAEENLVTRAENLYSSTGTQIVIVTVKTLSGQNIETYADTLLHQWKIGGDSGRGLILLLDIEEDIYVTISGDELKSKFTSDVLQQLLDEKLEPYFLVGQYEEGANSFFTEAYYMAEEFAADLQSEPDSTESTAPAESENKDSGVSFWKVLGTIIIVLIILIILFFAVIYIRGQIVRKKRREAARRRRMQERRAARSHRDYF